MKNNRHFPYCAPQTLTAMLERPLCLDLVTGGTGDPETGGLAPARRGAAIYGLDVEVGK